MWALRVGLDSGEEDSVLQGGGLDWKFSPKTWKTVAFVEDSILGEKGFLYAVALAAKAFLPINFSLARLIVSVSRTVGSQAYDLTYSETRPDSGGMQTFKWAQQDQDDTKRTWTPLGVMLSSFASLWRSAESGLVFRSNTLSRTFA